MGRALVLLFLLSIPAILAQVLGDPGADCFVTFPGPPWDAPQCTVTPLTPFCSEASNSELRCHPCSPWRSNDWECDCPPNYYCRPFLGRPDATYMDGYCYPFDRATQGCSNAADCDFWQYGNINGEQVNFGRFSCVGGFCRPCNQSYYGVNVTKTCGPWNHASQTGSSRPGETRMCGADGYYVGGGQVNITAAPTPSPSPATITTTTTGGSSTTSAAEPLVFSAVILLFSIVLSLG